MGGHDHEGALEYVALVFPLLLELADPGRVRRVAHGRLCAAARGRVGAQAHDPVEFVQQRHQIRIGAALAAHGGHLRRGARVLSMVDGRHPQRQSGFQLRFRVEGTQVGAKAFYFAPATDGSRGGTFFVNTEDPSSWGRFELEAMAFHEGVPGHHLQLAIAAELPDTVPVFRRHLHNSAYAEGWGLYSERLSDEMGLYSSSLDRMGMYSADSMRACLLVVDTGLHALGWSRQQAIDFMVANSPLTEGVCRPEVDRYICRPGQATSYMVGRLEIERIRREAEERQGEAFDVRRFHSAVLDSGSLPLGVLDRVVSARLT